jgi:tetratricopeptide (TPR) repeat protein
MEWAAPAGSRTLRFHLEDSVIQWTPRFERKPGPAADVPFVLPFPVYLRLEETIALPRGGAGFSLEAKPVDETVAATRATRTVRLEGGKVVAVSTFRRLARELPAAEAKAAAPALARLNDARAYVIAPADYEISEAERSEVLKQTPRDAEGYVDRGFQLLHQGSYRAALADFDKAIELSPSYARALANRGVALVHLERLEEAETALRRARELNESDFVAHQGLGMLNLARDKPAEAVEALTRSIQLDPDNRFDLASRLTAYEQLGKLREALADAERIAALEPDSPSAYWEVAKLHIALGEKEPALAAIARLVATDPEDPNNLASQGELLRRLGRTDEAMAAWAKALASLDRKLKAPGAAESELLQQKIGILRLRHEYKAAIAVADARLRRYPGNVPYLTQRCLMRAEGAIELALAQKDCDDAIKFDSGAFLAVSARGLLKLRLGQWDGAIADFSAVLAAEPKNYFAYYVRGIARLQKGDREAGERDLATARRYAFDVDAEYAPAGLLPEAVAGSH